MSAKRAPSKFKKGDIVVTAYAPDLPKKVTKVYWDRTRALYAYYLDSYGPYLEPVIRQGDAK